jgi:hypothetical protein
MKEKYIIVNLNNLDYFKDEQGNIVYYDSEDEARLTCSIYEFENVWVAKLIYNHIEK